VEYDPPIVVEEEETVVALDMDELLEEKTLDASLATDDSVALLTSSPLTTAAAVVAATPDPLTLATFELGDSTLGVPLVAVAGMVRR